MSLSSQDSSIPVLTEIIQVAPRAAIEPVPIPTLTETLTPSTTEAISAATPVESTSAAIAAAEAAPINDWLDEEWSRLELKISERVLTQLLDRIDTVLEQRINDSLAASLQLAVDEIRQGLQSTLDAVVTDAVAQEIDTLRFQKK